MHPQSLYRLMERKNDKNIINFPWDRPDYEEKISKAKTKHKEKFTWLFDPKRGVRWDFDPVYIRNRARQDTITQMSIANINKEISNVPWQIVEDENPEVSKSHPFERKSFNQKAEGEDVEKAKKLFSSPNPEQSFSDVVSQIMTDLLEVGSSSLVLYFSESDYSGDELTSEEPELRKFKPSDPVTFTKDYKNKTGQLEGFYQYQRNRGSSGQRTSGGRTTVEPIHFDEKEIVWEDLNPRSYRRYGLPPTLMILPYLELQDLTIEQEQRYFSRGMVSPGALVFEELDNKEIQDTIDMMESNMKGKPEKKVILGGAGGSVDYVPFSFNYKELEYQERQTWYAKIIASAFQVPISVLGLKPEDVNRSTFEGERRNFENNALGPFLQKLERMFTHQIVKPFFGEDLRFEFQPGMSEAQRSSISQRITEEWNSNLITRNEAREQIGYSSLEDDEEGEIFHEDIDDADEGGDMGDMFASKGDDNPFRETDNWQIFSIQPSDIEDLKEEISEEVNTLWNDILEDEDINEKIESNVTSNNKDTKNLLKYLRKKSVNSISRKIRQKIEEAGIIDNLSEKIKQHEEDKIKEVLENGLEDFDIEDIDEDAVLERIQEPSQSLIDNYTQRMEEEITDTISEGWQEGESIFDIKENLREKQEDFSDYQAERIARTEMHNAASEARNEFAKQTDRVEVWITSGDNRVRDAHDDMDGKWKRPNEKFEVEYEDGTRYEEFPGDSEPGINCRCDTILEKPENVNESDHAGVER